MDRELTVSDLREMTKHLAGDALVCLRGNALSFEKSEVCTPTKYPEVADAYVRLEPYDYDTDSD